MKTVLIVSIVGQETEGFLNKLTVATKALGGKWLANKMAHLDGQVAGVLKVEIDSDKLDTYKKMVTEFEGISFTFSTAEDLHQKPDKVVKLTLEGEDRSGLTSDITHLLYDQDVRVEHFESQRYPVTGLGTDVFEAHLDIKVPANVSVDTLQAELEKLSSRMRVFTKVC